MADARHNALFSALNIPFRTSTFLQKRLHQGKAYIQTFFCFLGIKLIEVYPPQLGVLVHPGDVHTMGNTEDCNARELNS